MESPPQVNPPLSPQPPPASVMALRAKVQPMPSVDGVQFESNSGSCWQVLAVPTAIHKLAYERGLRFLSHDEVGDLVVSVLEHMPTADRTRKLGDVLSRIPADNKFCGFIVGPRKVC